MTAPPSFPRTAYLWPPRGRSVDDELVGPDQTSAWFTRPLVVEEKLDGANVSLWLENGRLQVASRGGVGAMDRGRQLGRLRAWGAERADALSSVLADGSAMYAEWLWVAHGTRYDLLPDWLIVLDLWHPSTGFVPADARDERSRAHGLNVPPRLFEGTLRTEVALTRLFGTSSFATTTRREGLVLRREDGARCKVVDPTYEGVSDADWGQQQNSLAAAAL